RFENRALQRLAFAEGALRFLALREVNGETDTLIRRTFQQRAANQDWHAAAIFADVFLFIRRANAPKRHFVQGPFVVGAVFRRRDFLPITPYLCQSLPRVT